jgi:beta-glucanase (GH16 family)
MVISACSSSTDPLPITLPEPIPIAPPEGMELVWSDEFDGDAVDPANWTYDIGGWGWGNGEAQYYTDRPENARVQDGLLVIELRQEQYEDSYYTSARLKSQGLREWQYGRIEARIRVPKGSGTWPAFWMLGSDFDNESDDPSRQWPNIGEIDIMEYVGREPDLVLGTLHGPGYSGAGGRSKWNRQEYDIGDDFHTFAVDWDADGIRWFYDDEMYFEFGPENLQDREWVFDRPFFIILNLALGGTLGGVIAHDLEFPIQYYVDYVRVYQPTQGSAG